MLHLGTRPRWVFLSDRVEFPADVRERYLAILDPAVRAFQSDFARRLARPDFFNEVRGMVVQPRGLRNEGLMCFANASMQLLFASPYFVSLAHFMRANLPLFSTEQLRLVPTWRAFCEFLNGFEFTDCLSSDGELPSLRAASLAAIGMPTTLKPLDHVFGPFKSTRKPLTQEDASQFLMFFLNALHEEQLALMNLAPPAEDAEEGWKVQGKGRGQVTLHQTQGKMSPLSGVFSTLIHSDTRENGHTRNVSLESFLVLLLEIRDVGTIEEAISAFVREEKINERVSKKNSYASLPRSLIIGLNRFAFNQFTAEPEKLNNVVEYPDVLTMEGSVGRTARYVLSAIVEHKGDTPSGGHYVCWVKRIDGTWMLFDDDHVRKLNDQGHLGQQAYLLLYNQV